MNIYVCYRNREGKWVVDGENGREVYPPRFTKEQAISSYKGEFTCYECGKYSIEVYEHDISYSKGKAALVTINKFDENDDPIGSKIFYLPDKKKFTIKMTERDLDILYRQKEGSWL